MEIKKTLQVSKAEMDAFIKEMVQQDIANATSRKVKEVKAGYEYRKKLKNKMGKEGSVRARIEELREGRYRASFQSAQGRNTLSYQYEEDGEDAICLLYEETFDPASKSKGVNHQIMSFLYKRNSKKRIQMLLSHIEQTIQQKRKPV